MPNPAGREGWFVLPWSAARDALQPSLADEALVTSLKPLLAAGTELQPEHVRAAARLAASTGLAGRRVRHAGLARQAAPPGVDAMRAFACALDVWLPTCPIEEDRRRAVSLVVRVSAIADAATLLKADYAQRMAWVLDGWGLLAILWRLTPAEARIAVLRRCVALAPPAAEEMLRWPACSALGRMPEAPPLAPATRFVASGTCEAVLAEWLAAS